MLYLRRKAEIEVLSCASVSMQTSTGSTMGMDCGVNDEENITRPTDKPLLHYIVEKISCMTHDYERRYGHASQS